MRMRSRADRGPCPRPGDRAGGGGGDGDLAAPGGERAGGDGGAGAGVGRVDGREGQAGGRLAQRRDEADARADDLPRAGGGRADGREAHLLRARRLGEAVDATAAAQRVIGEAQTGEQALHAVGVVVELQRQRDVAAGCLAVSGLDDVELVYNTNSLSPCGGAIEGSDA